MCLKQGPRIAHHSSAPRDSARSAGKHSLVRIAGIVAIACIALSGCISLHQSAARSIFEAWRANVPLPLAHSIDETLTIADAYKIQREFVLRLEPFKSPAGFKAGLTSPAAQQRFKAKEPVAGVLIWDPIPSKATLQLEDQPGLNLEIEVAMRVGVPIVTRVKSVDQLRNYIEGIAPAIELPNLYYQSMHLVTAVDIVATNVAASYFVVGNFVSPLERDPNDAAPRMLCNDREVNAGTAEDAMGDQWQAALWLVNKVIDEGWQIEPGQILLTGALGRMVPGQVGRCVASFGGWGTVQINIE